MAKTKQCRDCKAEIPKAAKKCMHCGSGQRTNIGSGGLFLILIALYFVWSGMQPDKPAPPPKVPPTAEEIAAQKAREKAEKAETYAWSLCSAAIKKAAKFPSSVDISAWNSPGINPLKGGGYAVRLAFESKNGFGNMIPQMARCDVVNGKLTHFSVSNR